MKNLIRYPYCMVPDCPACGSHRTGRFFKERLKSDTDWIINDGLKGGELLEPVPQIDPEQRLFCLDCRFTWSEDVRTVWLTKEGLDEQKRSRGTYNLLKIRTDEESDNDDSKKKKGFFQGFFK